MSRNCQGITEDQMKSVSGCGVGLRLPRWVSEKLYCFCGRHDVQYSSSKDLEMKRDFDIELFNSIYEYALDLPFYRRWLVKGFAYFCWVCLDNPISRWHYLRCDKRLMIKEGDW